MGLHRVIYFGFVLDLYATVLEWIFLLCIAAFLANKGLECAW